MPAPLETLIAVKTADETVNNSATLQDDDHLKLWLPKNSIWQGFFTAYWVAANALHDMKWQWTLPSGCTGVWETDPSTSQTASSMASLWGGTATAGTDMLSRWWLTIVMGGTSGTVQLQWAQSFSGATNSTMKKGSSLLLFRGA